MSERKAYLFHTGIESSSGGQFSPKFDDRTFIFIPVPRSPAMATSVLPTYRELPVRSFTRKTIDTKEYLADYLKETIWTDKRTKESDKLPNWIVHNDPEFETFTYGQGAGPKRASLMRLNQGDLLIFYATLKPFNQDRPHMKYLIGYFTIKAVFDFRENLDLKEYPKELEKNAHIKEFNVKIKGYDHHPVIVMGDREKSRLLEKAIPLTDEKYIIYKNLQDEISWHFKTNRIHMGYRIFRGEEQVKEWLNLLNKNGQ